MPNLPEPADIADEFISRYDEGFDSATSLRNLISRAIKQDRQRMIEEFKACVPEKLEVTGDGLNCFCDGSGKDPKGYCNCDFSKNEGFNGCIDEIKKSIEEKFKERA